MADKKKNPKQTKVILLTAYYETTLMGEISYDHALSKMEDVLKSYCIK